MSNKSNKDETPYRRIPNYAGLCPDAFVDEVDQGF